MTEIFFAAFKSATATAEAAFSRVFEALWLQTMSQHRRFARRHPGPARLAHFS